MYIFQRYGTYTFLRHVGERKDFLYNDTAFAILKYVEEHPGCSCEELCRRLSLEFEAAQEELEQDVRAFAEELYASGILLKTEEVSHRRFFFCRERGTASVRGKKASGI